MPLVPTIPFEIEIAAGEGWLQRLVGLVERRGFEVRGLAAEAPDHGPARVRMDLRPRDAERRPETLQAQIRRIHGVASVRFAAPFEALPAAAAAPPFLETAS